MILSKNGGDMYFTQDFFTLPDAARSLSYGSEEELIIRGLKPSADDIVDKGLNPE